MIITSYLHGQKADKRNATHRRYKCMPDGTAGEKHACFLRTGTNLDPV